MYVYFNFLNYNESFFITNKSYNTSLDQNRAKK